FEATGQCRDQQGHGYRAVVSEGEKYLKRKPNSAIQPDIHFMMAEAYGDILFLATEGGGYGPLIELRPETDSARIHAIDHYRLAFSSGGNSSRAGAAWTDAWRVLAGLPP